MAEISIEEARVAGQKFKEHLGLSDAEFEEHISYAFNRRLMVRHDEMASYKIVAEVVEAQYCGAGCKVGQKLVFKSVPTVLLPQESDCGLCVKALGPVAELVHGLWDRMSEGLDPNEGIGQYASCLDLGLKYGGLGNVKFRVYAEKEGQDE
jgi:uncharacterized repeat protein (TIGR04076 family)